MEQIEKHIDFLEGRFSDEEEQAYAEEFANDEEFRKTLRIYSSLVSIITTNANAIEPSNENTNKIYSELGFKREIPPAKRSKYFPYIAIAVITSLLSFFLSSLYHEFIKTGNEDNIEVLASITENGVTHKETAGSTVDTIKTIEQNHKKVYPIASFVAGKFNPDDKNMLHADTINDNVDYKIELKLIDYSPAQSSEQSVYPNSFCSNLNAEIEVDNNLQSPIYPMMNFETGTENYFISLNSSFTQNIPKEKIMPAKLNQFNNLRIGAGYKLNEKISMGIDFRQETYYLEYTGFESDGIEYRYEQHANYFSVISNVKFDYYSRQNIETFIKLGAGVNRGGYILEASTGILYNISPKFAFELGLDYRHFFYVHQEQWFNTKKAGVYYGINYNF